MNFDFRKTLALVKGGILDREATWNNYFQDCPSWKITAIQLTAPLILANIVLGIVIGHVTGGFTPYGSYSNIFSALFWGLILAVLGFGITVSVFNFLAGTFKGKNNFSRAFAAISLAAIPSWLAGILAALLPGFFGMTIVLVGGITSLVFMYKIMPLALEVPNEKRTLHFIASLVVIIIGNMIIGGLLGGSAMQVAPTEHFDGNGGSVVSSGGAGIFGEIARQGQLMEAADADSYEPPKDDKVSKKQIKAYIKVMKKTQVMHDEYAKKMEGLKKDLEEQEARGETPSLSDMSRAYSSIGSAMGANNAEMEIVKTGGGNWAEHSWVKSQLRTARIQQGDGTEAISHNYELYQKYKKEIGNI